MVKKRNKLIKISACAALIIMGGAILIFPDRYATVCFEGLCLWAQCVLPCLFPFMVICALLIKLGAVDAASRPFGKLTGKFRLPSAALPLFIMSVCSGYPAGSRLICEYYESGILSREECKRLSPLCSACGPLFALGTVGHKAFGGGGLKLWLACLISVISTSLIYCLFKKPNMDKPALHTAARKDSTALYSAFYGGVTACLTAGGFICFFYTLARVFGDLNIFLPLTLFLTPLFGKNTAAALCNGFCEATCGCFLLAASGGFFALPLAGFLITFGGASILLQQICYLDRCGVSAGFFVLFKFIQGIVCFALLCVFCLI